MSKPKPVVIIIGPTASGKSSLALDLAGEFQGTVINADSMQVYRELRILTARPGAEDEAQAPHKVFGVLPASEACSAGRWLKMAAAEIETAWGESRLPLVVGGTGLYVKALTEGLAPVPEVPDAVNDEVRAHFDEIGGKAFKDELEKLDPKAAASLPAGDRQRLERFMAVVKATGRPLSEWQGEQSPGPAVNARFLTIQLLPEREDLYAAADARFDEMMNTGALEEVEALLALDLDPMLPAMKAVGVPELGRYLNGAMTLEDATAAAKQATRNFAKRQMTWLRNQVAADVIIEAAYDEGHRGEVVQAVGGFIA